MAYHADDPARAHRRKSGAKRLANRIAARKIHLREIAVDHHHARRLGRIFESEKAPSKEWYSHRANIIRPGNNPREPRRGLQRSRPPLANPERHRPGLTTQRNRIRKIRG